MKTQPRSTHWLIGLSAFLLGCAAHCSAQTTTTAPVIQRDKGTAEQQRLYWTKLATEKPEQHADAIVPELSAGLRHEDSQVRMLAAATAAHIAAATSKSAGGGSGTALTQSNEVREALMSIGRDSDIETQRMAVWAMVASWPADASVRKHLIGRLKDEATETALRETLILSLPKLAAAGALPEDVDLILVKPLSDPTSTVRAAAANSISKMKVPPAQGLEPLIPMLKSEDHYCLQYVIKAIGNYRSDAKPYLPQLREALRTLQDSGDPEGILKLLLENAIRKIEEAG